MPLYALCVYEDFNFLYTYDTITSLFLGRDVRSTSAHLRTVRGLESHIEERSQPQGNPYLAWVRRFVLDLRVGTVVYHYKVLFESLNFLDGLFGCSSF
jgi:hypothetical protein